MAAMFPAQQPLSVKVVGANAYQGTNFYNASVDLEYEFPQQWVLVQLSTHEAGDTAWITEFQVQQMSQSIETINHFTLGGKSGLQYALLLLAVSSFLLSLYAFVVCSRTKGTAEVALVDRHTHIGYVCRLGRELDKRWTHVHASLDHLACGKRRFGSLRPVDYLCIVFRWVHILFLPRCANTLARSHINPPITSSHEKFTAFMEDRFSSLLSSLALHVGHRGLQTR